MSRFTNEQRMALAHRRSQPHLEAALRRMLDHGVPMDEACRQMIQFAACGLMVALTEQPRQLHPVDAARSLRATMDRVSLAAGRQFGASQGGV